MRLNDDFAARAVVDAKSIPWLQSPESGVERRMLFRIGDEKARATSIVRYAPGSRFSRHVHTGGEEIFVLDGTFQDETGDYPVGSYLRNPPGTSHTPGSASGCTIFVRLWQFRRSDRERVVLRPGEGTARPLRAGVESSLLLFEDSRERVVLERWQPAARIELNNDNGLELLIMDGACIHNGLTSGAWTWIRVPPGEPFIAQGGNEGTRMWCRFAPALHGDVCEFEEDHAGPGPPT